MFLEQNLVTIDERVNLQLARKASHTGMDVMVRSLQKSILVFVCLFTIACGKPAVKIHPVRGEVFFNGKPAAGAVIHFHPVDQDQGPPAFATVDEDGSYELTTIKTNDGAAAGEYIVTVNWFEEKKTDEETIQGPDRLGGLWGKRDISKLTATVNPGPNEIERFDLKK
jgi:hypothetical protein